MSPRADRKSMTIGEGGLGLLFAVTALTCLTATAKAEDAAFSFHATLGAAASVVALFTIFNRYQSRPATMPPQIDGEPSYHMRPVQWAATMAVLWAIAAFVVGLWAALELAWPVLNFGLPWTSFGRIRPLHTSAAIFAFGGNVLLATSFYVVQKTCRARLAGELAPWFVVLGYNFFLVIAGTGYVLGVTQSKDYAEPEWYADLWLTIVWITYLLVFLATLMKREEPRISVANWFYLAFIVGIAMVHLGNSAALPVSIFGAKSYVAWSGVQDAMVQAWYGQNVLNFFLALGFVAVMYYFPPNRAGQPIYSHRLAAAQLWATIFLSAWTGAQSLHYTALPDWTQTLGMTFAVMLWVPLLGGAVNGMMTLAGTWVRLRGDPVLRMMAVALVFYLLWALEGTALAVKSVSAVVGATDVVDAHVHSGALGWMGFMAFGALYCLAPRLCGRAEVYSLKLVEWHFWIATAGTVLYVGAMGAAGIQQGLMARAYGATAALEYSFVAMLQATQPFMLMRALGGALFVAGAVIMAYNLWMTVCLGDAETAARRAALQPAE